MDPTWTHQNDLQTPVSSTVFEVPDFSLIRNGPDEAERARLVEEFFWQRVSRQTRGRRTEGCFCYVCSWERRSKFLR